MSKASLTPREIERWTPTRLQDFIGCKEAKVTLVDHLRVDGDGTNLLILGNTGTGKTSLIEAYLRTRNCPNSTDPLLGPCGTCSDCETFDFEHEDNGIFAQLRKKSQDAKATHFFHVNCYTLNVIDIEGIAKEVGSHPGDRCIVYLDEVHALAEGRRDMVLLKHLRELKAVWLATGIDTNALNPMFLRRFAARCMTTLPSERDLALFLLKRCVAWSISFDEPETLALLAQRSQRITAECISVLAQAAGKPGRRLDRQLVEAHPFISGVTRARITE
jgi:replication-associated recombination protein RarA